MSFSKKRKGRIKKARNQDTLDAIVRCKSGTHKDKRDKRGRRDELWRRDLD